jgi:NADH:ubiquinone oxidoreductase subunit K
VLHVLSHCVVRWSGLNSAFALFSIARRSCSNLILSAVEVPGPCDKTVNRSSIYVQGRIKILNVRWNVLFLILSVDLFVNSVCLACVCKENSPAPELRVDGHHVLSVYAFVLLYIAAAPCCACLLMM